MTDDNKETKIDESLAGDLDIKDSEAATPEADTSSDKGPVSATEMPEGLDVELWDGDNKKVKTDALLERYQKAEKRISDQQKIISKGGGKPAQEVSEYKVEFSEEVAKYVPEEGSLSVAKQAALDAGMSKEMFEKFAPAYMEGLLEKGIITNEMLPKDEKQLAQEETTRKEKEMAALGKEGKLSLDRLNDRVTALFKKGVFNKEDVQSYRESAYDAKSVLFLTKWVDLHTNATHIPTDHVLDEGLASLEQLDAMAADPRMSDPAFRERRSEGYRKLEAAGVL